MDRKTARLVGKKLMKIGFSNVVLIERLGKGTCYVRGLNECLVERDFHTEEEANEELNKVNDSEFAVLFDVADELDGGLRLDQLSKRWTDTAESVAVRLGLSWPPNLAEVEEYALRYRR